MNVDEEEPLIEREREGERGTLEDGEGDDGALIGSASIYTILPLYSLISIATYMLAPVRINWMVSMVCRDEYKQKLNYSESQCQLPAIQSIVSEYSAICSFVGGLLGLYSLPIYSKLSDRIGRKPILAVFIIGDIIVLSFMSTSLKWWSLFSYKWIIFSYIVTGLFGSAVLSTVMVSCYVTDSVKPHNRIQAMSYITACVLLGKAIGPFISSQLIGLLDGELIGVTIAAVFVDMISIICLIFTPESKVTSSVKHHQESVRITNTSASTTTTVSEMINRLNIFKSLHNIWTIAKSQPVIIKRNILILISIDLIYEIIISGRANIAILYPEMKFSWTAIEVGYLQSVTAIWRIVLLVVLVPLAIKLLQKYYKEKESRITPNISNTQITIIGVGNLFEVVGYIGYGLATNGVEYAISYFISTTGVMAKPTVQSSLMNLVPADRIGEFLGSKGVLDGISGIVFSSLGLYFYSYTVAWKPEIIFYVCASGYFMVVMMSLYLKKIRR